ncbi:hypothetical protein H4R19_006818, partial [Coemansia spiralis]
HNILATNIDINIDNKPDCPYIEGLSRTELRNIWHQVVFVDPGRVDLLYFMHIDSTPEEPRCGAYTRRQRNAAIHKGQFQKIRNEALTPEVHQALRDLSMTTHKMPDLGEFERYLRVWGHHVNTLHNFYTETRTHMVENVHSRRRAAANDVAPVGAEGGVGIAGAGAAAGAGAGGQDQPPLFQQLERSTYLNVVREDE